MNKPKGNILYPAYLFLFIAGMLILSCGSGHSPLTKSTQIADLPFDIDIMSIAISDDFQHVAYLEKDDDQVRIVVDGKAHEFYDKVGGFVFSPDSKRSAYWAKKGDNEFPVIDGIRGKEYSEVGKIYFSPDSKRTAYFVDGNRAVIDGVEGKTYEGIGNYGPIFSPDSRRVAYEAINGWTMMVVVDSVEGPKYTVTLGGSLTFDPTSQHVAYLAKNSERYFVVVDGVEGKPYGKKMFREVVFSPDGNRVAYTAQMNDGFMVIVNDKEGKLYDGIQYEGPKFSPDSRSYVYGATSGMNRFCVLNGKELKKYDGVGGMIFNPKKMELAYFAAKDEWQFIVKGEKEIYRSMSLGLGALAYSPDGEHLAFGKMNSDTTFTMLLDGRELGTYDYLYLEPAPAFNDSGVLVFAGTKGRKVYRMEVSP